MSEKETVFRGKKDSYVLLGEDPLARGRLTDIFLASSKSSHDVVAIKVFRSASFQSSLRQFYREIGMLQSLKHENILELVDYSEEHSFLVLPHMPGGNARELLTGRAFSPIETVASVLTQVAAGLDYAHDMGVVHGDIKPENILLNGIGDAVLADFGVARNFDVEDRLIVSTPINPERGSSAYLSPEQLLENRTTPASDIYSFGLVAYELLAGRLPFDVQAPLLRQLVARTTGELVPARDVNSQVSAGRSQVLMQALEVNPSLRPTSAVRFVEALSRSDYSWDIFIAHASADTEAAEMLFNALEDHVRVFVDTKLLKLGDDWDMELASAQRRSLLTVVLVSENSEGAYYQREEIAAAIAKARKQDESHRVVPVYLDRRCATNPPYGLATKHGITLSSSEAVNGIAVRLVQRVKSLQHVK